MAEVVIRPAEPEDVPRLVEVYEWLFAPPGSRPELWDADRATAALGRAVSSQRAFVLVADLDGELVGFCTGYQDIESVRFGPRVWVEDLAVDPERRSLGTGKLLLDEAKRWARASGATHLELDSSEVRVDAHRFYDRENPTWRSMCFGWQL